MIKKTTLFPILFLLFSWPLAAQIKYVKATITTTGHQQVEGLIRYENWLYNPEKLFFKTTEDSPATEVHTDTVAKLTIEGQTAYIQAKVLIDWSTNDLSNLETKRAPDFKEAHLFLKVLVDGKAKLYQFTRPNLDRYFFQMDSSGIRQLVYKVFMTEQGSLGVNNQYKQQIIVALDCESLSEHSVKQLSYCQSDLERFFLKYNACATGLQTEPRPTTQQHDWFNITLKPGLTVSSFNLTNSIAFETPLEYGNKTNFRFSIDLEFPFQFNENRWAFFAEPTLRRYKSQVERKTVFSEIDYQSLELPLGLRYHYWFKNGSALFADAALVFDFDNKNRIICSESYFGIKVKSMINFGFGLGYQINKWLSISMTYQTPRDITSSYKDWKSDFRTLAFYVGFTVY